MSQHIHTLQGLECEILGVIPGNAAYYDLASGLDFMTC